MERSVKESEFAMLGQRDERTHLVCLIARKKKLPEVLQAGKETK